MNILGYTYEAACHCENCAENRFGQKLFDDLDPPTDKEGNEVHPIFETDEFDTEQYCDECGISLEVTTLNHPY